MSGRPRKPGTAAAQPTRALDRGLLVLETIAERAPLSLAEISAACDLSPATALRILKTLENRGYVTREAETRAYWIGLKSFEVGSRFLSETRLAETCRLILRRLSATTGQSATLAVLHGADIVYIDAHEGSSPLRSAPQIGMRAPAYATASGKCLLSGLWGESLAEAVGDGPFPALTGRTITDRESLLRALLAVRREGIATDAEEFLAGISCAACPVRDRSGDVIAAMAIRAPSPLLEDNADAWLSALRAAASESSHRLGWRDPATGASTSQLTD